jgi:hypothetical protein
MFPVTESVADERPVRFGLSIVIIVGMVHRDIAMPMRLERWWTGSLTP